LGNINIDKTKYTIGKVAMLSAVSADTLRHYEKKGLVTPTSKTASGYRLYNKDAVHRVHLIKQAQSCGFTLSDIRELFMLKHSGNSCCKDIRNLTIEMKLRIEHKLTTLQAMSRALNGLIENCNGNELPINNCTIMDALQNGLNDRH